MKELKDLKVGDKVIIYSAYGNRDVSAIERITKTLVVVKGNKYRKSDGFRYGNVLYTSDRIEAPKDEEQKKRIELEYRKKIIIHRIHNLNLNDYPLEVLEKVYIELGGNQYEREVENDMENHPLQPGCCDNLRPRKNVL